MKIGPNLLHNLCNSLLYKYVVLMVTPYLSPITIVQILSAQLLWNIKKSIFSGCIEKSRILCYNILSVGIGPAKATVWKGFHAVFILK